MIKFRYLYLFVLTILAISCSTTEELSHNHTSVQGYSTNLENCFNFSYLNEPDRVLADSLIYQSLNNTGLHTFTSTLKPMSDIAAFRWQVEPTENDENLSLNHISEYKQLNRIADAISCGPLETVLTPFKRFFDVERYVQMRVYRRDAVNRVLDEHPEFWSTFTFAEGSHPAIVIQTMEYESASNRFKGYGFLYGYPAHAVDFFVEAAESEAETGEFVARDFMQMPVVSGEAGRFVYAVPKDHEMNDADKTIKRKAEENVQSFNERAHQYYDGESFNSELFLRNLFIEKGWIN